MVMKSGLLWYDADPKKATREKIDEAAARYAEKFGVEPNACHVAPGVEAPHDAIEVVPDRWIRPGYFWLGVDEELPVARPRRSRREGESIGVAAAPTPSAGSTASAPTRRRRRTAAAASRAG
jgi:hypothetical protein